MSLYEYRARVVTVVDGDTVRAEVDLGCDATLRLTIRLFGIDAPEMGTPDGIASKEHLVALVPKDGKVLLATVKDRKEKYGRYLGTLTDPANPSMSINDRMIANGFALRYVP